MRDKVGLLATARKKAATPGKVVNFYKSPLFVKSVEYAKQNYSRYYFYNAKDGLLLPDDVMYPYNVSIRTFSSDEKKEWAYRVIDALAVYESPDNVDLKLHGGFIYREYLEPALTAYGFQFEVPLKGFSIGKQLKWYKDQLDGNK